MAASHTPYAYGKADDWSGNLPVSSVPNPGQDWALTYSSPSQKVCTQSFFFFSFFLIFFFKAVSTSQPWNLTLTSPGPKESGRPPCALRSAWLEQMERVYHGGCRTSLVTSDVSPINTHGGGQLLEQQNVMVEKMVGRPGPDATPII